MRLKTFRASTMAGALAEVKRDLGKDAVILHTRTMKVGGWLGLGGKQVVEIIASDDSAAAGPRIRSRPRRDTARASEPAGGAGDRQRVQSAQRQEHGVAIAEVGVGAARVGGAVARGEDETGGPEPTMGAGPLATPARFRPVDRRAGESIETELAQIKRMVGQVLQSSSPQRAPGLLPDALFQQYLKLLQGQLARELADEIVGAVRDELSASQLADEGAVRTAVLHRLTSILPAQSGVEEPAKTEDGRPRTIALIGPTGVGKTTTLAKLAAAHKLRHGLRVGLITTDTYRIAAVDQLRTYAEIISLPLKVVLTAREMANACSSLADCDVVLIDTAGRSPNDSARLDELREFIAAAQPHETHLVLSSTASEAVLLKTVEQFSAMSPNRVIFTKLDEAVSFGVLVNVARRVDASLSYFTTGQEVPDHLEPGTPGRLARLVLDGEFSR